MTQQARGACLCRPGDMRVGAPSGISIFTTGQAKACVAEASQVVEVLVPGSAGHALLLLPAASPALALPALALVAAGIPWPPA
jgi:hypothetical protein